MVRKLTFPHGDYVVVNLNIPVVGGVSMCDITHKNLVEWFKKNQDKTDKEGNLMIEKLFKDYTVDGVDEGRRAPIDDDCRYHSENFLKHYGYCETMRPIIPDPSRMPTRRKQIQYVLESVRKMARYFGGKKMLRIYCSLLVSLEGGGKQSYHEDVAEGQLPGKDVIAVIVSLKDGTAVEIKTGRKEKMIFIPKGFALLFNAKTLIHRGIGYQDGENARLYMKFAAEKLLPTESESSEVVPMPTCEGCLQDIGTEMKHHRYTCVDWRQKVQSLTREEAVAAVEQYKKQKCQNTANARKRKKAVVMNQRNEMENEH